MTIKKQILSEDYVNILIKRNTASLLVGLLGLLSSFLFFITALTSLRAYILSSNFIEGMVGVMILVLTCILLPLYSMLAILKCCSFER